MSKHKNNIIFISGTGTHVGKTFITGALSYEIQLKNKTVITQKWVQSGSKKYDDIKEHLKAQDKSLSDVDTYLKAMCPYQFELASSPHLAARKENKEISIERCLISSQSLSHVADILLIEGSGGLMVPLNSKKTYIDCLEETQFPTVVVAENSLGSINHTLLSIEALKVRQIPIIGVIFTQIKPDEDPLILEDNPDIVAKLSGLKGIISIPFKPSKVDMHKKLSPIVDKIVEFTGEI